MNIILIKTDGTASILDATGPVYMIAAQHFGGIPGTVYPRGLKPPFGMLVDDIGFAKELPVNEVASLLYQAEKHGNVIVGDVFLVRKIVEPDGSYNLTGIEADKLNELLQHLEETVGLVPTDMRERKDA